MVIKSQGCGTTIIPEAMLLRAQYLGHHDLYKLHVLVRVRVCLFLLLWAKL